MSEKNEQVPSTMLPIEECNCCMYCPMMCQNSQMLRNQMMPEYNGEDFEDEEGYRPGPGGGHGPGGNPGPGGGHGPGGNPGPGGGHGPGGNPGPSGGHGPGGGNWHKTWHGHGGYYGSKYYKDINYFYYLNSRFYPYYPYDPYYDYYYNIY